MRTADERRRAHQRGLDAESAVAAHLEGSGWSVLDRNWRGGGGELDLVVARGAVLRFVEVKARDEADDTGLDAIDEAKQRKLVGAAEAWLLERAEAWAEMAFLVAEVRLGEAGWDIALLDDAFDGG